MRFDKSTKEFIFSPTKLDSLKDYQIDLDLIDSFSAKKTYSFILRVYDPTSQENTTLAKDAFQLHSNSNNNSKVI